MLSVKEITMHPIRIPELGPAQVEELDALYRTTRDVRLRTRAQMVLLAAEQRLTAAEIASTVSAPARTRCGAGSRATSVRDPKVFGTSHILARRAK